MTVRTSVLDNGLTILSDRMPGVETVALGLWVRAGARNEPAHLNGISHFLEHMAFKGTARRTARQIAEEIEAVGGEINAATAMENTAYYARVLKGDLGLALDMLADILINPAFEREEIAREREVILQEIAAANDAPDDLVFDLAQWAAYPDQAIGRSILGTVERVSAYDAVALEAYRDGLYGASRMVLSVAGAVDHDELVDRANQVFRDLKRSNGHAWAPARFVGGEVRRRKRLEQAHLVLAFPAPGYRDADIYALQVLSGVLGGGMSSRLFQEVREKRALCYSVFSFTAPYEDSGILGVYAAAAPEKTGDLVAVLSEELLAAERTIGEEEVSRARAQLKAGLVMSLESSSARADQIARQMLAFGRVPEIAEIMAKVDAITAQSVRALAGRLLHPGPPALGAVGALKHLARYDAIAQRFR